jgi:hypothetical protein
VYLSQLQTDLAQGRIKVGKISTCLGHQGVRGTTKIRLQGNLFISQILGSKTPKIKKNAGNMKQSTNKCYRLDLYMLKQ